MNTSLVADTWERGSPYEQYIGRWSRKITPTFLSWLSQPAGKRWLDIGCGTGALSAAVLDLCAPSSLIGVEPSEGFLKLAAHNLGSRARLIAGSAQSLPIDTGTCDVVVSGLVLNFIPDLPIALSEMTRVTVPGGTVAAYVWDYADGMEIIKVFWDVATSMDPAASRLHEGARFPVCNPFALHGVFEGAGFNRVETASLDVTAGFIDFEDYWRPFLGGQGPAPAYAMSLPEEQRTALRLKLESALPVRPDGTISLQARAWAVRGMTRNDA